MKLRRFAALLLAGVTALALAGCAGGEGAQNTDSSAPEGTADLLSEIQARGELVIALEGTWSPWSYHDEDGVLTGYDVEVGRLIARELGVEAAFVEGQWDGLFAGLDSGRYDMVINGVDVDEARSEKYDFTEPYAYNRTVIITRADDDRIASFEDLDGMHTANTLASTYAAVAEQYGAETTGVDDLLQTIALLESGRIDATLNAEVTFYDYMDQHPDTALKIAAVSDDATTVAIPLRKGEETASLREAVNGALEGIRASGELGELSQRFFGVDISSQSQ